ncbi:unnamed protein product, partial [Natator depressus]
MLEPWWTEGDQREGPELGAADRRRCPRLCPPPPRSRPLRRPPPCPAPPAWRPCWRWPGWPASSRCSQPCWASGSSGPPGPGGCPACGAGAGPCGSSRRPRPSQTEPPGGGGRAVDPAPHAQRRGLVPGAGRQHRGLVGRRGPGLGGPSPTSPCRTSPTSSGEEGVAWGGGR